MDTRNVVIEQHKRFSESALWRMQREYFDQQGIDAWVNQVPFYITSNPFIAKSYARIVVAFIRDCIKQNPDAINHPFYLMELGTGSGRFSYYTVKTLDEMLKELKMDNVKICYVMTDFTKHNVKYWESHPALLPYIERGMLDFALYDMETERPINLIKKNQRISSDMIKNPLIVFANYIFDTISHDSFAVHEGKLYELLLNLSTGEDNMKDNRPVEMEKVSVDYNVKEVRNNYYGDPHLDSILEKYKTSLRETSFLFPIGSFNAIKLLKKLSNNRLLIISTDKGYSELEQLDNLGHPSISFHGSFSMMVNFHAMAEYFKNSGGDAVLQTSRRGIKTSAFLCGMNLENLPETKFLINECIEGFSPSDYFTLHRRISDSFNECSLETIAAHMHLAGWDPHIYLKLTNRVTKLMAEEQDNETINFMATYMPKMAANYYHMPKSECILFEIGVFFHAAKRYADALDYYKKALPYVGEQFGLFYNMALCQQHLEQHQDALETFKKALALDPESNETKEWMAHIEKSLAEK